MDAFNNAAILVSLGAVFGNLNYRYLKLATGDWDYVVEFAGFSGVDFVWVFSVLER